MEYAKKPPKSLQRQTALTMVIIMSHSFRQLFTKRSATRKKTAFAPPRLNARGFTLVELLVVTVLLGVLSILGLSSFATFRTNARNGRAIAEIRAIEQDINAFALAQERLPTNLGEIGRADLIDPWGNLYEYKRFTAGAMRDVAGTPLNTDFDLYSKGADSDSVQGVLEQKSKDDIVRTNEGGWVGLARTF